MRDMIRFIQSVRESHFISFVSPYKKPFVSAGLYLSSSAISHEWVELSSGCVGSWAASSDNRRANKNSSPQDLIWISNMSTWKRYKINHLNSQCKLQSDPKFPFSLMYLQQWQSTDQTFNSLFSPQYFLNISACHRLHLLISTFYMSHYYDIQWMSCTSSPEKSQILILLSMFQKCQMGRQLFWLISFLVMDPIVTVKRSGKD